MQHFILVSSNQPTALRALRDFDYKFFLTFWSIYSHRLQENGGNIAQSCQWMFCIALEGIRCAARSNRAPWKSPWILITNFKSDIFPKSGKLSHRRGHILINILPKDAIAMADSAIEPIPCDPESIAIWNKIQHFPLLILPGHPLDNNLLDNKPLG